MDKTLTIRLDRKQQAALAARAKTLGTTRSALVRELIARGLEQQPQERRIGHLRGGLDVPAPNAGWARTIKERNWR